ncbi:hypothetical protein [Staphylococcus marylandisciuri]|nr:hypothetical protein [Staphylococcus marylandisciuri]
MLNPLLVLGAGPQHRETGKSVSASHASWGGPIKAKPEGSGTTKSFYSY